MKQITSLQIINKSGDITNIDSSKLAISGNRSILISDSEDIVIDSQQGYAQSTADALIKYNHIINKTGGFDGVPYYVSKINRETPNKLGGFFFNVFQCYHTGLFTSGPYPEDVPAKLSIVDVCPPDVDCDDFNKLDIYIETIKTALDTIKSTIEDPGGKLDYYIQLVKYYNYIVHLKSWQYNAEAKGYQVDAACKFVNRTTEPITNITITITFTSVGVYGDTRVFHIDHAFHGYYGGYTKTPATGSFLSLIYQLTSPLEPNAGVRFYAASLSMEYKGVGTSVPVTFTITANSSTGPIQYTNTFTTNNMVVIDSTDTGDGGVWEEPWDESSGG